MVSATPSPAPRRRQRSTRSQTIRTDGDIEEEDEALLRELSARSPPSTPLPPPEVPLNQVVIAPAPEQPPAPAPEPAPGPSNNGGSGGSGKPVRAVLMMAGRHPRSVGKKQLNPGEPLYSPLSRVSIRLRLTNFSSGRCRRLQLAWGCRNVS